MEAVGDLLELDTRFDLLLRDVFYVPTLQRNLISVSRLDDDGFECRFGNGMCVIDYNDTVATIAFKRNDLYLLSLRESVNSVCDVNATVPTPIVPNRK